MRLRVVALDQVVDTEEAERDQARLFRQSVDATHPFSPLPLAEGDRASGERSGMSCCESDGMHLRTDRVWHRPMAQVEHGRGSRLRKACVSVVDVARAG